MLTSDQPDGRGFSGLIRSEPDQDAPIVTENRSSTGNR